MDRWLVALRVEQYVGVVISALLMWAAFPDVGIWPASLLSLVILIAVIENVSVLRGAWLSALWAMIFFLPHISWMNVATNQTYLAWIALALAQAFFLALWGGMFAATRLWSWARTWWGEILTAAVLWVGIEQLRARVPLGGFPWAKVPYSLVDSPLLSLAPLGGEVLVAFAAVAIAVLVRQALVKGILGKKRVIFAVGALAVLLLPALHRLPTEPQNGTVSVLAVQGNVEIPMEETYSIEGMVTGNHLAETERAMATGQQPDLVIWGEDALDRDPQVNQTTAEQLSQALELVQVPFLAGYQEYEEDQRYNWFAVWDPHSQQIVERYGKQHPVPWGEFVPWRGLSEFLAVEAAAISVDMVAVDNPAILTVPLADGREIPVAVGICFEAGDEQIIAEGVRLGGELIVIPTNNSHFRDTAESTQQLQMTQFRAAEFSRATLQVSTNGVSAVVRPDGTIEESTGKQVSGHLFAELPLRTTLTPAAKWEETLALETIAAALILGAASLMNAVGQKLRLRKRG